MMISLEKALERILQRMNPVESEQIAVTQADGRVLSESLIAGISLPMWDNSAMDGFALRAEDVHTASPEKPVLLSCLGEGAAGKPSSSQITPGTCLRIFTGSPMPEGADAVVMQEDTSRGEDSTDFVQVMDAVRPFENVRFRGEDIKENTTLASAGSRLSPFQASLAAATGSATLQVYRRPRVGILATGSELRDPGDILESGCIYESNRLLLRSLVRRAGAEPRVYPIVKDTLNATCLALSKAVDECDAIVTSGGVSVGDYDFIKPAIEALHGDIHFWRMRVKPGKPIVFGSVGSVPIFGLPGNPVSATVTCTLLVHPALARLGGERAFQHVYTRGRLAEPLSNRGDRHLFLRVSLGKDGVVRLSGANQASHALGSLAASDGLLGVPEGATLDSGEHVSVICWPRVP
ncbi:MAG: molybdopterin molybdotransferase MoeA [Verrucomicrobiota bacterium]|nr:molybdopterin molybdotransferase MoeA [Verrucomicrobiota bacterium]